jgi:hypothetical protein
MPFALSTENNRIPEHRQRETHMKTRTALPLVLAALLAGCAATTPTRETSVGYAIYDIKAGPEIGSAKIAEAIKTALQKNTGRVQISNGIPPSPLPQAAPRFQLVSPLKGSNLGALAAASGQSLQVPTCEGATLTANARDSSMAGYGENTSFFACLMPYLGGYSLNIYTTFTKASGSFNAATLGATLARPLVGDSGQFIPRTIGQIVQGVQQMGAIVTLVEAYPS